jgi:Zn-dependent protease with chaperone function
MESPLKLGALPYHRAVANHLRSGESALWAWFESEQMSASYSEKVKLELLKSTYRLTRADRPDLYAGADIALERLGVDLPAVIYQRQGGTDSPNAALVFLPDEAAIMLMGNVGELLNEAEMLALLGHEIAHHRLYTMEGGQYFTAARLLGWCVDQPGCEAAFAETDRLFQLHTEIFADLGALHVTGDRDAVIASLVKVTTGLKSVSPNAYLEQAEEILEKYSQGSEGISHPETFIRAKALDLLAADPPGIGQTELLVRGPIETKRLDILGQQALSATSRRLVDRLLTPSFMRNDYTLNLAERYFPGYGEAGVAPFPEDGTPEAKAEAAGLKAEVAATAKSCHDYFAYLLLDFATVDPDCGDAHLAWSLDLAGQIGIFPVYEPIARKELKRKKDELTKLKRGATQMIEKANDVG